MGKNPWESQPLGNDPEWDEAGIEEVRDLLNQYRPGLGDQVDAGTRDRFRNMSPEQMLAAYEAEIEDSGFDFADDTADEDDNSGGGNGSDSGGGCWCCAFAGLWYTMCQVLPPLALLTVLVVRKYWWHSRKRGSHQAVAGYYKRVKSLL